MTQEEKARAYDEALEKAKEFKNNPFAGYDGTDLISALFPELKESEDEKTRKEIKDFFSRIMLGQENFLREDYDWNAWIAWLEKQSKASKVEESMREVEEKAKAFTGTHKGETSEEILAQMKGEQKPTWSKEDEYYYGVIQYILNNECVGKTDKENAIKWFNSLKDRVQPQPRQEWSEEDETALGDALWCCKQAASIAKDENDMGNVWYAEHWLKSLKQRATWKPSEGQLECLEYAIEKAEKDWSPLTNNRIYLTLKSLKEQLEKL